MGRDHTLIRGPKGGSGVAEGLFQPALSSHRPNTGNAFKERTMLGPEGNRPGSESKTVCVGCGPAWQICRGWSSYAFGSQTFTKSKNMKKKTNKILFEKKRTQTGREYFQGIDDHKNMFFVQYSPKKARGREIWALDINIPKS